MADIYTVSVQELQDDFERRTKCRMEIYKKILEKCYKHIKICSDNDQTYCIYELPYIILGTPSYRYEQCIQYAEMMLREKGDNTQRIKDTSGIFITWNIKKPDLKRLEYNKSLICAPPSQAIRQTIKPPVVRHMPVNTVINISEPESDSVTPFTRTYPRKPDAPTYRRSLY